MLAAINLFRSAASANSLVQSVAIVSVLSGFALVARQYRTSVNLLFLSFRFPHLAYPDRSASPLSLPLSGIPPWRVFLPLSLSAGGYSVV